MSKIVEEYIKLNSLFIECTKNDFEGASFEKLKDYNWQLNSFINEARNLYNLPTADVQAALDAFLADAMAQEELKQKTEKRIKTK